MKDDFTVLAWLDRHGLHVHNHSTVEFPPPRWPMEFDPRRVCRCGSQHQMGSPTRWFLNEDGEWDYDDALYE